MWVYVVAIVLVILVALWIRRTNLYRHFRSHKDPGQAGYGHSGGHFEGSTGARDQSTGGGPGSG